MSFVISFIKVPSSTKKIMLKTVKLFLWNTINFREILYNFVKSYHQFSWNLINFCEILKITIHISKKISNFSVHETYFVASIISLQKASRFILILIGKISLYTTTRNQVSTKNMVGSPNFDGSKSVVHHN